MARYTLALDDELYKRVKAVATAEDRSIAGMLRRLIAEALAQREKKMPAERDRRRRQR